MWAGLDRPGWPVVISFFPWGCIVCVVSCSSDLASWGCHNCGDDAVIACASCGIGCCGVHAATLDGESASSIGCGCDDAAFTLCDGCMAGVDVY